MSPLQTSPAVSKADFMATAIDESITLPAQAYTPGAELRFNLPQVGVAKKLRVLVSVPVTQGGTAATAAGAKAPFSLFSLLQFRDYAGINRVQCSPWALNLLNIVKKFGWDASYGGPVNESYASSDVWNVTKDELLGWFDIPISASEHDPTGSLNLEVTNGVSTLVLTCNPNFASVSGLDTPLVGPAGCTATPSAGASVTVVYYFWQPVTVSGKLIRPDAVLYPNIIHELLGTQETDNIAAGQEKLFTLRTGREYHRILHSFVNNGALSYGEITQARFLYNGNTPTIAEGLQAYLSRMRDQVYRDLPAGTAYFNFTRRPWDSNKWGQLQTGLLMSATANMVAPYLETLTEAFYAPASI